VSGWSLLSRDNNSLVFCVDAKEYTHHTASHNLKDAVVSVEIFVKMILTKINLRRKWEI